MRTTPAPKPCRLPILAAFLVAAGAWAGDPVPDVDVILEQIPGGVAKVRSLSGGFDEAYFEAGKDFAKAMNPTALPAGWAVQIDGKTVRLTGPAINGPLQFKFDVGSAPRPARITYGVKLGGRTLVEHKNVAVKLMPPQPVIGSLQGIVQMPTQVAPGEAMQIKVLDPAALPAGGTWSLSGSLSGTVTAEEEREDPEDMTPGEPKRRVALRMSPGRLEEVPGDVMEDIAAVLLAQGAQEGSWEVVALDEQAPLDEAGVEVWTVARGTDATSTKTVPGVASGIKQLMQQQLEIASKPPAGTSNVMKMKHDAAMAVIQNVRAEIATKPAGGGGIGVYSVRPTDVGGAPAGPVIVVAGIAISEEDIPVEDAPRPITIEEKSINVTGESRSRSAIERVETAAETPGGGKVHTFDISGPPASGDQPLAILNNTRSNIRTVKSEVVTAATSPDGTVTFDQLPDDLQPGGALAMQYVDAFGDVLVDVPSVPGVEVVEPRGEGEARITDATPRTLAGQLACVCGSFPEPAAWDGVLLDGQAVGSPTSASGQMVWVQLPAGLAPGEHVFTGDAAAGFPATDRAATLVLQVGGEIDSSKLQRLETTPMRLWVVGTEEPLDVRVRNLTPAIISIEGGEDQTIRTSGGAGNMLERTVRGISPGAFNINYELAGESCPCAAQTHYY